MLDTVTKVEGIFLTILEETLELGIEVELVQPPETNSSQGNLNLAPVKITENVVRLEVIFKVLLPLDPVF